MVVEGAVGVAVAPCLQNRGSCTGAPRVRTPGVWHLASKTEAVAPNPRLNFTLFKVAPCPQNRGSRTASREATRSARVAPCLQNRGSRTSSTETTLFCRPKHFFNCSKNGVTASVLVTSSREKHVATHYFVSRRPSPGPPRRDSAVPLRTGYAFGGLL